MPGPVIAPSYDGGTTLLGPVPSGFTFAYGIGSYTRHLAAIPTATPIIDARLALDIDSARDLDRALATHGGRWLLPVMEILDGS
jgi:2-phospho-L-lactate guanylyltransferase (CobY/MobA/RfbA family)